MDPLRVAGRLGAVILQFPPWFEAGSAGREYLGRVRDELPELPLAAEFRHPTWQVPVNQESTLETLIELEVGTVVADFPSESDDWYPPFDMTTVDDLVVVRLHGQNADGWARTLQSPAEPVTHTYSDADLAPWVGRVRFAEPGGGGDSRAVGYGTARRRAGKREGTGGGRGGRRRGRGSLGICALAPASTGARWNEGERPWAGLAS